MWINNLVFLDHIIVEESRVGPQLYEFRAEMFLAPLHN